VTRLRDKLSLGGKESKFSCALSLGGDAPEKPNGKTGKKQEQGQARARTREGQTEKDRGGRQTLSAAATLTGKSPTRGVNPSLAEPGGSSHAADVQGREKVPA